jgi:hypothetical protein
METGRSTKDMTADLEREELFALQLEMTTKEAIEKGDRDFIKTQTEKVGTQSIA